MLWLFCAHVQLWLFSLALLFLQEWNCTHVCILLCFVVGQISASVLNVYQTIQWEKLKKRKKIAGLLLKPNYFFPPLPHHVSLFLISAVHSPFLCVYVCICVGKAKVWITSSQLSGSGSGEGGEGGETIRMTDKDKGKEKYSLSRRRVRSKMRGWEWNES